MINVAARANTTKARKATKIIEEIVSIFGSLKTGKRVWHATPFEKLVTIERTYADCVCAKSIGVRIEREKVALLEPRTRFGKRIQVLKTALEPLIIVRPMLEHAKIRYINVDLIIGARPRPFADPRDSLVALPLREDLLAAVPSRKDLNKIFYMFKENFPEFKCRA